MRQFYSAMSNICYQHSVYICLFQLPVDYGSLSVTQVPTRTEGQWGVDPVIGLCYFSGRLYAVERDQEAGSDMYRLTVYHVTSQNTITLLEQLDTLDLGEHVRKPRIDRRSGRVYIPSNNGVFVVRYDGSKLVLVAKLKCVRDAGSLAVVSPDTLYVSDLASKNVCLVDSTQDKVTTRLQKPWKVKDLPPFDVAFLGDTVLVREGKDLVVYQHGIPTPGKVLPLPKGLQLEVHKLTTDHHSSFLLTGQYSNTVGVLDVSGNLTHTIPIPEDRQPRDCTVVGGQLWVACENGVIVALSSQ